MAEETKRICPLVGQLARNHSWYSCSSLLHPPAINRTLHHSGSGSFTLFTHSIHTLFYSLRTVRILTLEPG
ncbi:hypothetical protein Hanom_Chr15g01401451 [Helianthus anomalus]